MNKSILSAFGAFISILCAVITLTAFAKSGEFLFALMAVFFTGLLLTSVGYGIEDTKIAEKLSNLFGEEVSHE